MEHTFSNSSILHQDKERGIDFRIKLAGVSVYDKHALVCRKKMDVTIEPIATAARVWFTHGKFLLFL